VDPELGFKTLHQGSTAMLNTKQMASSMATPLITMIIGFIFFFAAVLLLRARNEILERERRAGWVREMLENTHD
jgi:heme exporter protein C